MSQDVEDYLHAEWKLDQLVDELRKNTTASDARVLRVLAARIAAKATMSGDPCTLAEDLSRAFESLREVVRGLVAQADEVPAEESERILTAVDSAAVGVHELTGWF